MKTIIAMLRRARVAPTVAALRRIDIAGMVVTGVRQYGGTGRAAGTQNLNFSRHRRPWRLLPQDTPQPSWQRRRKSRRPLCTGMLVIFAGDESVTAAVQAIIDTNRAGRHGDGEIYVCPMVAALDP